MYSEKISKSYALMISILLLLIPLLPMHIDGLAQDELKDGPYLNHVVYKRIPDIEDMILAIQEGEIDLIGQPISPTNYTLFETMDDIEVASSPRNGFGVFYLNCAKYPYNITAFRQAIAHAFDKEFVASEIWQGFATAQDCPIPVDNYNSAEGLLDFSYYEGNVNLGNQLLDAAGFFDINDDGFREMPNGEEFDMLIEVSISGITHLETGEALEEACLALGINVDLVASDLYQYIGRIPSVLGDFDCVLMEKDYDSNTLAEFAMEYLSENADEPYINWPNFRNETFDYWGEIVLSSIDFEEIYEAGINLQEVWVEQCPGIIAYQNQILSAYRTDYLEGFVNSIYQGVPCWWTNFKAQLVGEQLTGGTLLIGMPLGVSSFNFMVVSDANSETVLSNMYDSLIRQSPDGTDILWLTEAYTVETHQDNTLVPEGYTRFTFDIRDDVTWSDGTPLTAEDVAFSLNYYRDAPGHPYGRDLSDLTAAYAQTVYRMVAEFQTESYWHLHSIGYKQIIPKHVFEQIGLEGWNLWNPDPPTETMVTSGPFNVTEYEQGELVELTYNPDYFFGYPNHPADTSRDPNRINTNPNDPNYNPIPFDLSPLTIISYAITIPSIIVIIVVLVKWRREQPIMFTFG